MKEKNKKKEDNKETTKEKKKQVDDQKSRDDISIKEFGILTIGIIIIISAIIFIPKIFQEEQKTLDELHIKNYQNPPTEKSFIYNGFSFVKIPEPGTTRKLWYTQYQQNDKLYDIPFHYSPKEVENITTDIINPLVARNYSNIYITIEPRNTTENRPYLTLSVTELSRKLTQIENYYMQSACTKNTTKACSKRPIINCTNSEDSFVIRYKDDQPDPKLIFDGNCIIVEGKKEDLVRATDKLLYLLLDIYEK